MVIHEQSPILPKQTASVLNQVATPNSVIRAAAVHMVFAARLSQDFITPDEVKEVEKWTGQVRHCISFRSLKIAPRSLPQSILPVTFTCAHACLALVNRNSVFPFPQRHSK